MLPPAPDEIHVWCAGVHVSGVGWDCFQRVLSQEEARRAGRFIREEDRKRFTVARGLLRCLLAGYLKAEPGELRFDQNAYGKPKLEGTTTREGLCFNLSHSGERVLYAFAYERKVGVDIEQICPRENVNRLVRRFFSEKEIEVFNSLPASLKTVAFFSGWTRKEAYMKACGKGLSMELNTFSVSLSATGTEEMIQTRRHDRERTRVLTVRGIPSISGYVGAVAAEGRNLAYRFWNWENPNPSPICVP